MPGKWSHKYPASEWSGLLLDVPHLLNFNLRNVAEERSYSVSGMMSWTTAHEESSPFLPEIAGYWTLPSLSLNF